MPRNHGISQAFSGKLIDRRATRVVGEATMEFSEDAPIRGTKMRGAALYPALVMQPIRVPTCSDLLTTRTNGQARDPFRTPNEKVGHSRQGCARTEEFLSCHLNAHPPPHSIYKYKPRIFWGCSAPSPYKGSICPGYSDAEYQA